jgi:hypothetical protein
VGKSALTIQFIQVPGAGPVGRRGGGGRGLLTTCGGAAAATPPRRRRAGCGPGPGFALLPAGRPALAATRASGCFSGMRPGGRSWRGGKRSSTLSLRPADPPAHRGGSPRGCGRATEPSFLPRGPGIGRSTSAARGRSGSVGAMAGLGPSCPLPAACSSLCVCPFLTSSLLGNVSGWECWRMPQGNGGFEEVKNGLW